MVFTKSCLEGLPVTLCSRTLLKRTLPRLGNLKASYTAWSIGPEPTWDLREDGLTAGVKGVRDRPAGERCIGLAGVERE